MYYGLKQLNDVLKQEKIAAVSRLKDYLLANGMNQSDLSRKLDLSRGTISRWMNYRVLMSNAWYRALKEEKII